jgi:serine/threonine-protein kinase
MTEELLIFNCLQKDPAMRPSADDMVIKCEKLCYPNVERRVGNIDNFKGQYGFIIDEVGQTIFFHMDSVYGPKPQVGNKVCFSAFPGNPRPRAHPVILMQ